MTHHAMYLPPSCDIYISSPAAAGQGRWGEKVRFRLRHSKKKDLEEKQNSINDLRLCIEGKDQRIIELEETIEELKNKILN